jgi:hypothetical protein
MKLLGRCLLFLVLTVVTQVGGLVYVLNHLVCARFLKKSEIKWIKRQLCLIVFYCLLCWLVVPSLAKYNNRVRLPSFNKITTLGPQNWLTVICNRNYVSNEMYDVITAVANDFNDESNANKNRVVVQYLDANFPFIDGFPLIPHLSHNDGNKLDLALRYKYKDEGFSCNKTPSLFGYGIYEGPTSEEIDQTAICKQTRWQYDITKYIGFQLHDDLTFDEDETKRLLKLLTKTDISKIFIEPHLKQRMGLTSEKIRFHGCHAVRHDDHVHIEMR